MGQADIEMESHAERLVLCYMYWGKSICNGGENQALGCGWDSSEAAVDWEIGLAT